MGEDDNVGVHVQLCLLLQAHILQVYHPAMSSYKLACMRFACVSSAYCQVHSYGVGDTHSSHP